MSAYAYQIVKQYDFREDSIVLYQNKLNELGAQGWRIVSILISQNGYHYAYMERVGPAPDPAAGRP